MRKTFSIFHFHCLFAAFLDFLVHFFPKKLVWGFFFYHTQDGAGLGSRGRVGGFLCFPGDFSLKKKIFF